MNWRYQNDKYPERDTRCFVIWKGRLRILCWNAHYECWDDECEDDYVCDKEMVEKWIPLDEVESNIKD